MDNVRRCFWHARTSVELRRSYPVVNAGCLSKKGTHWFGQTFRASGGHTNQCHRFVGQNRDDFQRQITGPTLSGICRAGQGRRPRHTRPFGGVAQCRAGVGVGVLWVLVLGSVLMLEFKEADNEDMEKELDVELRVCSCNKPNTFNNVSK